MRNYVNIEPSKFRPNEYVGYACGTWRIARRRGGGWTAVKWHRPDVPVIYADTLKEISSKLTAHEEAR